jgi:hypothetical protein
MPSSKQVSRCHHINTAGVQCGSPAVSRTKFCYYHHQGRSTSIRYYSEAPYCALEEDLPLFEDAHSIQIAIRQVASLLMNQKIEHKTASLLLYSMQLALMNLRMLQTEKPHPAQLTVEPDRCEETMPEPEADPAPVATPVAAEEKPKRLTAAERKAEKDAVHEAEIEKQLEYLLFIGRHLDDPADTVTDEKEYHRLKEVIRQLPCNSADAHRLDKEVEDIKEAINKARNQDNPDAHLPPGTIQARAARPERQSLRRHVV